MWIFAGLGLELHNFPCIDFHFAPVAFKLAGTLNVLVTYDVASTRMCNHLTECMLIAHCQNESPCSCIRSHTCGGKQSHFRGAGEQCVTQSLPQMEARWEAVHQSEIWETFFQDSHLFFCVWNTKRLHFLCFCGLSSVLPEEEANISQCTVYVIVMQWESFFLLCQTL